MAYSKIVCGQFNARGIPAFHIDADTDNDTRQAAYESVARGELTVLCNYGVMHRGFDCPPISAA